MSAAIAIASGAALAALLDTLDARGVRLALSADRAHIEIDAPRGALTPELETALRAHKGELLGELTRTPAPVRAVHVCAWGAPHFPHWRYSAWERRYVCGLCFPDVPLTDADGDADGAASSASASAQETSSPRQELAEDMPQERQETSSRPSSASEAPRSAPEAQERPGARPDRREEAETLAVLDTDGLHIARPGKAPSHTPVPDAEMPATLGALFDMARAHGIGQLWVTPDWAEARGLPRELLSVSGRTDRGEAHTVEHASPLVTERGAWDIAPLGVAAWYYGFQRGTYGARSVIYAGWHPRAPWKLARSGRTLLDALCYYRAALGTVYYRSTGATGAHLIRTLHSGRNTTQLDPVTPDELPSPARENTENDTGWIRALDASERERGAYVHGYDKHAAYLGACSSLALGTGASEHVTDGVTFDQHTPGYWLARIEYTPPSPLLPDPFTKEKPRREEDGAPSPWQWYTTPTIELAYDLGAHIELREAYIWPEHHRVLEPWYKLLRDARSGLMQDTRRYPNADARRLALAAVKLTYARTSGWLAGTWHEKTNEPDVLYRPDWRHAMIAQARANLYRNMLAAYEACGVAPFAWATDAFYYASADADARASVPARTVNGKVRGLALGDELKHYSVKTAGVPLATVAPLLAPLDEGKKPRRVLWTVLRALGAAEDETEN